MTLMASDPSGSQSLPAALDKEALGPLRLLDGRSHASTVRPKGPWIHLRIPKPHGVFYTQATAPPSYRKVDATEPLAAETFRRDATVSKCSCCGTHPRQIRKQKKRPRQIPGRRLCLLRQQINKQSAVIAWPWTKS